MPMTTPVRGPVRDAVVIGLYNHGVLLLACALGVSTASALAYGVLLSFGLTVGTLTVLHDAGHRMFGRKELPNVLAVQLSTPAGLWVGHWTLKHRVHHKMSQVYPVDEATRSSSLVRLHPAAPHKPWQRWPTALPGSGSCGARFGTSGTARSPGRRRLIVVIALAPSCSKRA
jgi:fatty acid desaturase